MIIGCERGEDWDEAIVTANSKHLVLSFDEQKPSCFENFEPASSE